MTNRLILSNTKSCLDILPYCQRVTCFQTNSVDCTLVANWESGYADPWLVLSDLSPSEVQIYW